MWQFEHTTKRDHFRQAFQWHLATPRFLTGPAGYTENDESQFVEKLSRGLNWAGYEDGIHKSLVYGEETGDNEVLGHIYALRHTSLDFLTATATFAKNEALRDYDKVIVEIPSRHTILQGLILRAGFFDTLIGKMTKTTQVQIYAAVR